MKTMGLPKNKYNRWHRYDENGVRQIRNFIIGVNPNIDNTDQNCTEWIRGNGKMPPETYDKLVAAIKLTVTGKPKSDITKQRMSEAARGVPKAESHKANMRLAHKARKMNQTKGIK